MPKKKPTKKKTARKKAAAGKKASVPKKRVTRGKRAAARKPKPAKRRPRGPISFATPAPRPAEGLGPGAGGQSGDTQGIPREEEADSESIEELAEEGQSYEAEVLSGVEEALDPDEDEVRTREDSRPREPEPDEEQ